jgi:hypothetical protein
MLRTPAPSGKHQLTLPTWIIKDIDGRFSI